VKPGSPNRALSSIVFIVCLLGAALLYGEAMYRHGVTHCEVMR
jgi:hypothetical protein